jgi:hypothetical protein
VFSGDCRGGQASNQSRYWRPVPLDRPSLDFGRAGQNPSVLRYRYDPSIRQAEFSLTRVLDRPVTGRIFFEKVVRENLEPFRRCRLSTGGISSEV